MADKNINIAVILSAYDKMTAIFNTAINGATKKLSQLQAASNKIAEASTKYGRESIATGMAAAAPLVGAAKAFADQEEAMLRMRAAMTQDGNVVNQKQLSALTNFARKTSEELTGSTTDYLNMVKVMQENGIKPEEILGGIGNSVAKLAVFFKMAPDSIAQFAARMKQDMGIMPKEMNGMMDLVARLNNAGVGKNGEEAVMEMGEAFSKAGLGAHNLGIQGLQASKDLGALMGIFIRRGISGQTVGNNFRRIFDGLRDGEKLKKANDVAKQYGVTLDFYDKNHKFKGIAAFTAELNKLKGLNTNQVSAILKPFGGKQGLSTDFLEFLGKEGTSAFNEFQHKLSNQATLGTKVNLIMGGLSNSFERTKTTAINAAAAFGATYAPQLKQIVNNLNVLFSKTTNFINTHKALVLAVAKGLAYFAAFKIASGALALVFGTVFKTISQLAGALRFLFISLRVIGSFMIANPIVLAIAAVAVAAFLIYKYWDPIKKFFINLWGWIKTIFLKFWEFIKIWFMLTTPLGMVIKYWGPITKFFSGMWDKIKGFFLKGWEFIKAVFFYTSPIGLLIKFWGPITNFFGNLWGNVKKVFWEAVIWIAKLELKFFNAGKNIIKSIWEGMKSAAMMPINGIKNIVQKIRDHLPFSPAKVGPLRDIHRIKLVETIAANIKAKPMLNAMNGVLQQVSNYRSSPGMVGVAGGHTIHFSPEIHIHGNATGEAVAQIKNVLKSEFDKCMKDWKSRNERRGYN